MTHGCDNRGKFNMRPDYRDLWVMSGYRSDMGSAVTSRPPGPDFRRLYHLTSAEFAVSNLWLGRLKVARINDLNDPFEFMPYKNTKKGGWHEESMVAKAAAHEKYGLLCFSEDWTSPALWGHYGDKHRGVCLGFNVRCSSSVFKVQYRPSRVEAARANSNALEAPLDVHERLSIKSADWSFEREWRRIIDLSQAQEKGGLHFVPFDADLELAEVILGERCSLPIDEMCVRTRERYPRACVIKSRSARQHFSVVPDEGTIPTLTD